MTQIIQVETRHGITEFANAESAESYRKKWGGKILNTANAAIDGITSQTALPVRSPGLCGLLGLDTVALNTPGELEAAWSANGSKSTPRDTDKIVHGLIAFWRGRKSCDVNTAAAFLKERHPLLFPSSLAATAGTAGANEAHLSANEVESGAVLSLGPTVFHR
jgi:hypothetical protein